MLGWDFTRKITLTYYYYFLRDNLCLNDYGSYYKKNNLANILTHFCTEFFGARMKTWPLTKTLQSIVLCDEWSIFRPNDYVTFKNSYCSLWIKILFCMFFVRKSRVVLTPMVILSRLIFILSHASRQIVSDLNGNKPDTLSQDLLDNLDVFLYKSNRSKSWQ